MYTKRITVICVVLVLVAGVIGGGYYYWWTGTPQYSLLQLKDAVNRGDSTTALSYFNSDAIFDNLWVQVEAQASAQEAQESQSGGAFGSLGAMIGQSLIENLKPQIKQKFVESLDAGIMNSASSTTAAATTSVASALQNTPTISSTGATTTVAFGSGISFEMTQESHSHWVVVAIDGLLNASSLVPSAPAAAGTPGVVQSTQAPQTSQKFGTKTELVSLNGQDFKVSLTISSPQLYQSTDQFTQPQTGNEFITVLVRYDNESGGAISYSGSDFSLVDAQSNRYQSDILGRSPQLGSGAVLNSGQSAQGYVTFEVPVGTGVAGLKVHYESPDSEISFDFSN
jgi:hypothetical protein